MTSVLIGTSAMVLLLVLTWAGPVLIRTAAPVLMRMPRIAVTGLLAVSLMWWAAVAALSLMAAWLLKGPDVLPIPLADVCQRCLVAANPFSGAQVETLVPVIIFLLFPLALSLLSLLWGVRQSLRRRRANAATASHLLRRAQDADVDGQAVKTVRGRGLFAFSLPRRYGGVVLSEDLHTRLEARELTAVLEHERAHVDQGHHRIISLVDTFIRPLSFIPLFAEVAGSIPLYLEIAADDRARKVAGTPALASALLKIGPETEARSHLGGSYALSIAGPDRIRQLVAPASMSSGLLPVIALTSVLGSFAVLFTSVVGTYAVVLLTGCTLP